MSSTQDSLQPASASALPEGVTNPNYKPLPGRLGNLTIPQQHALEKFRKEIENESVYDPERMDDAMLLRFLRARKWDVAAAKKMFLDAEKWRVDYGVDDLYYHFDYKEKPLVDKFYPQYYHKTDKDGRPVYIERLGQVNITELRKITSQERQVQSLVHEYERFLRDRLPACSAAVGYPVETSCTIMDLKNVGVKAFWQVKEYVQQASAIGQNYYPETMGKFYIINAPWLFSSVWSVIKGWLDPVTVAKIYITSGDPSKELLAQIPAENLPVDLGGKCQCDGGCSLSDAGPWNVKQVQEKVKEMQNGHHHEG